MALKWLAKRVSHQTLTSRAIFCKNWVMESVLPRLLSFLLLCSRATSAKGDAGDGQSQLSLEMSLPNFLFCPSAFLSPALPHPGKSFTCSTSVLLFGRGWDFALEPVRLSCKHMSKSSLSSLLCVHHPLQQGAGRRCKPGHEVDMFTWRQPPSHHPNLPNTLSAKGQAQFSLRKETSKLLLPQPEEFPRKVAMEVVEIDAVGYQ